MNVFHLRLTSPHPGQWQFCFWSGSENPAVPRDLALAEIKDLAAQAETYYYTGPADVSVGRRLFRWLDGPDRALSQAIEAAHHGDGPLVLAIHATQGLAHLPWETMADDTGFLVARGHPAIVPARWHGHTGPAWPAAENRPLHTLFMAAAPEGGGAPLQFEVEEGRMFRAAEVQGRRLMELTVEESGCLTDLSALVSLRPAGAFDIFHLTGHADHDEAGGPVFLLENDTGGSVLATAPLIAGAFSGRLPRVVFLSGCRTAQNPGKGEEQSLAAALIARHGLRAVLGWGRPVRDDHAILAAEILYRALAVGDSLPAALSRTWQGMISESAAGWHLLRLHYDGGVPGPLVTAPATNGRAKVPTRLPSEHFLIPGDRRTKVPGLEDFVGRRRLLQRGIRRLRDPQCTGIVLHGTGGLGKSSVVSRWADRLRGDFLMAAVFGLCDEFTLVNALAALFPHEDQAGRDALQGQGDLFHRLAAALDRCEKPFLFVLDDFERNQDAPRSGEAFAQVQPDIVPVLQALVRAVGDHGHSRLIITTRYSLPAALVPGMEYLAILPMDDADQAKRVSSLARSHPRAATQPPDLRERAVAAAGGNHRLLGWLYQILDQPGLDHAALLAGMEAEEERFRTDVLATALCAALSAPASALLTALQVCEEPVPLAAAVALRPTHPPALTAVAAHLATAVAWGLAYIWEIGAQPHWLAAPFLRPILGEPPADAAAAALAVLQKVWWDERESAPEDRLLELHRLALAAGQHPLACDHADRLCANWLSKNRSREAAALAERTLEAMAPHRDPRLLTALARALQTLGDGHRAAALFAEAAALQPGGEMDDEKAASRFHQASLLLQHGKTEESETIYRDSLLPFFTSLGEAGLRSRAVTQGQIADILMARGQLDEALRIRQEEQLPVFEKLGDVRSLIVGRAMVAQMLAKRGHEDDGMEIINHLAWAWREARRMGLPEAAQIEEIAGQIGVTVEVLAQFAEKA